MNTNIMTVNGREFETVNLLGKGKGGYSYLVRSGQTEYVLKQIHHEPCDYYTFGNKIEAELYAYKTLSSVGIRLPALIDCDETYERILKEYICGRTIYDYVLNGEDVSPFVQQIKQMCSVLYPAGINIDYFPTNFVVQQNQLYYIDYECNSYSDEWNFENWGITYWSKTQAFLSYAETH